MKKLCFVVLACLCLLSIGAKGYKGKPQLEPMHVTYECRERCGIDCTPCDDCIGADEKWGWVVEGALAPGESYTYIAPYDKMCHTRSEIDAAVGVLKGNGDLRIRLDVWEEGYHWVDESNLGVCMIIPTGNIMERAQWSVTVTNVGRRTVKHVYLIGIADGLTYADATCDDEWGHSGCPVQYPCP